MNRQNLIAARIKQAREESGLSQEEVGKHFGCSDVNISRIERGITGISISDLERLASVLGKPLGWFLSDKVSSQPRPLQVILREARERYESLELVELPIRGTVPAGYPFPEEEEQGEFIVVPRQELGGINPQTLYALKIGGDSLQGDEIYSGHMVIVNSVDTEIVDGRIYIVRLGNESCARHVFKQDNQLRLVSSNGEYKELLATEVEILGRVILSGRWRKH